MSIQQFVTHDINSWSNGILMKLENNFTCVLSKIQKFPLPKGLENYLILAKTCVELFPNFTRHHLITNNYGLGDLISKQNLLYVSNGYPAICRFRCLTNCKYTL